MFNFLRKKSSELDLTRLQVSTDIHSHILPGLDDGARDMAASLRLIKGLSNLGITKAVATPHVIWDMYRNTPEKINEALQQVKAACVEAGIEMELSAAAEYMIDDFFMEMLQSKSPLLTIHNNLILTEIPYTAAPSNLDEIAFELITAGYKPIMAHPERYFYYHGKYENFARLKELGFLLQVNLLSLTGYYGSAVAKAAKFIFENDLADLVGTDMHHSKHLSTLSQKESIQLFDKYLRNKKYNDFPL